MEARGSLNPREHCPMNFGRRKRPFQLKSRQEADCMTGSVTHFNWHESKIPIWGQIFHPRMFGGCNGLEFPKIRTSRKNFSQRVYWCLRTSIRMQRCPDNNSQTLLSGPTSIPVGGRHACHHQSRRLKIWKLVHWTRARYFKTILHR